MKIRILNKIRNKIWYYIKECFYTQRLIDSAIIQNMNNNCSPDQKRVLICYLVYGYFPDIESKTRTTITNEIFKIVKVFSELGYSVDIIRQNDIRAVKLVSTRKYHLIFGFGESFYRVNKLQPNAISILYMTENHPDVSLARETERIEYFYKRHNRHAEIARSGRFYKKEHLDTKYSHVITLSETAPHEKQYDKPYAMFPTGMYNHDFVFEGKDHHSTRKNFLWLGSTAVIHKGLDLLIDVFSKREDCCLHVCGLNREARKLLRIPPGKNIIDYGYININSGSFKKIAEGCTYSILPSCSEATATSITTSMLHGLIPVVMKDAGFNRLGSNAIFLEDYRIEYLDNIITELVNYDPGKLSSLSRKVFDFAHESFSLQAFEDNFRTIILDITGSVA